MTTIAIMQPYLLPYVGYFQLMAAVDKFVVLDDVHYINRGWINRNRLLVNGAAHRFTVPLLGASQNRLIYELQIADEPAWRDRLVQTFLQAYSRAQCRIAIEPILRRIIHFPTAQLDSFIVNSLREIAGYLSLKVLIEESSRIYQNRHLKAQDRILDICRQEGADCYVNPIGGTELYDAEVFAKQGISLKFLQSRPMQYSQGRAAYVAGLSIIDVLMFNEPGPTRDLLTRFDLG